MKTGHRFMKEVGTKKCRSAKRTHTLMIKSSLSTARSVNARWCRAQHTAPTASELPSISCPTQWARCHHLRSQHFVRGSRQNEQGCDTHPQWLRGKRGEKSFSSIPAQAGLWGWGRARAAPDMIWAVPRGLDPAHTCRYRPREADWRTLKPSNIFSHMSTHFLRN